jgi:excisionase family DNA binding protein
MEGVSVPEAAKCLGITAEKVRKLLEEGTLKGFRPTGGNWKVPRSEIRDFSNRRRSQS